MFLTQIIGCIVAALVVAVLWLGVELHRVRRDVAWHRMEWRDEARQMGANVRDLYGMMEGRDDSQTRL